MAEHEIRKHLKTAYTTMLDKDKGFRHKLVDISVEVLIIVFAVTVSIWFHNWSEKSKDHKEAKAFLADLKKDLQADSVNIGNSLQFYQFSLSGIEYFQKVGRGDTLSADSLQKYGDLFFSSTELQPHISRYEALKVSGKFDIIENKELLNNIIYLHESVLNRVEILNTDYAQYIKRVAAFIDEHAQINKQGHITNGQELLRISQLRLLLAYGRGIISGNLFDAHHEGIRKCKELREQIDKTLK